ncbi:hypothetical protein CLIB1423_10S00826 [[Candida] railenensis]|uniref:Uncharacterized protein n=1 Tax=[Candida] railenensis TaxID=45579 RepID=A0A9P0VYT3_9ASCO|nr:hypothetical protein CLIB1423_10S00826 [[Candida] railenensis]
MAASLLQAKEKRKLSELEDITNSNTYRNKKSRSRLKANFSFRDKNESAMPTGTTGSALDEDEPQQQRSPSPSDVSSVNTSSSPVRASKPRSKSVTFANETRDIRRTDHKTYEESPLLTPKEEEDDYEETKPKSLPSPDAHTHTDSGHHHPEDLDHNTDYITLASTLRLLYSSKNEISNQIIHLSKLLDFHSNTSNKEDVIEFVLKLINNELNLPKQAKIIRTPQIEWSKYHQGFGDLSGQCLNDEDRECMYKSLKMFEK